MEALQILMTEMQRMNAETMVELAKQMGGTGRGGTMTDSRGIGRPITYKGDESKYAEWKAKLLAYLRVSIPRADDWIRWSSGMTTAITEEDVDLEYGEVSQGVKDFAVKLYSILMSCTEDDAFRICHSVKDGNGLEAMRLLMKRYEPRTPGTKRALLKAVINNPAAKKPDEIEKNLMHVEELMKKYEVLSGQPLPEDLRVTVIIDLCTKDLKEHLELITREMTYKDVRDEIQSYVERKRDQFGTQLKAMEVDNHEEWDMTWWGGKDDWYGATNEQDWEQGDDNEVYQMQYWGKGKGPSYGGKGKGGGKSYGGKGYGKDGGKGYGKDGGKGEYSKGYGGKGYGKDKGKGKGGGFQGNCHWCGEWGHSQSRCRKKDEYMDDVRKKQQVPADSVEVSANPGGLATLEGTDWRTLCCLEENRFGALMEEDEEEDDIGEVQGDAMSPPGLEWRKVEYKQKKAENKCIDGLIVTHPQCKGKKCKGYKGEYHEMNSLDQELNAMHDDGKLWITIDSGASENVIGEGMAPQYAVKPSEGSRAGVRYVAANGQTMANKGEKDVKVITEEGHKCMLKMQVTDVKKPLMSVSRICDAGHRVVFTKGGGTIEHEVTGQVTKFGRVDNVYRLKVDMADKVPVFSRQGR